MGVGRTVYPHQLTGNAAKFRAGAVDHVVAAAMAVFDDKQRVVGQATAAFSWPVMRAPVNIRWRM